MADAEVWGVKKLIRGEGRGLFPEKRELGIASDAEAEAIVEVVGREGVALRRAAVAGVDAPDATAQQTVRTSRRSCGVCHASCCIRTVPILAPLPNIAKRVIETQGVWEFGCNSVRCAAS